jgi:integrase
MPAKRGKRWAAYGYDPATKSKRYLGMFATAREAKAAESDYHRKHRRLSALRRATCSRSGGRPTIPAAGILRVDARQVRPPLPGARACGLRAAYRHTADRGVHGRGVGEGKPATYNRHMSTMSEFFKFQVLRGQMHADPTQVIERAKEREPYRETSSTTTRVRAIIACQESLRDRIALRLLLHYGLRRGALQAIQFKHFDHVRKRLTVFLKGGKVRGAADPGAGVLA